METTTYLFLNKQMKVDERLALIQPFRDKGLILTIEYDHGFEVVAAPDIAKAFFNQGGFIAYTSEAIPKSKWSVIPDEGHWMLDVWNVQFEDDFPEYVETRPEDAVLLSDNRFAQKTKPSVDFDLLKSLDFLREAKKKLKHTDKVDPVLDFAETADELVLTDRPRIDEAMASKVQDLELINILGVLFFYLEEDLFRFFNNWDILLDVIDGLKGIEKDRQKQADEMGESCLTLFGRQGMAIVVVESSRIGGPKFSGGEQRALIRHTINAGGSLVLRHPTHDLSFVPIVKEVEIDVNNRPHKHDDSGGDYDRAWQDAAMNAVEYWNRSYSKGLLGVIDFRVDLKRYLEVDYAFVVFATPFGTGHPAYASANYGYIVISDNPCPAWIDIPFGGHGWSGVKRVMMHEILHLYGASDEYSGACHSTHKRHGCMQVPNGNCEDRNNNPMCCVMLHDHLDLCPYTQAQVGWAEVFVELKTSNAAYSGTDDAVELDIGPYQLPLHNFGHNSRERGAKEGYSFWSSGFIKRQDFQRLLIRKSKGGLNGGWRLEHVRVYVGNEELFSGAVNKWLDNNERFYLCAAYNTDLINSIKVRVWTDNSDYAGTDDDVTFSMAGQGWVLDNPGNDFERADANNFYLDPGKGLKVADIDEIRIHKSPDGAFGGWKLDGLQITVNGNIIYDRRSLNRWLQDNNRTFIDNVT